MPQAGEVIFGYQHVTGTPRCPCDDPGDYLMLRQRSANVLECELVCWCGRSMAVDFDDEAERLEFVLRQTA